jgi:serine/threonine protein kinase
LNINTHDKHVFKFCFQPDRLRGLKREVVLLRLLKETLGDREDIARVLDWNLNTQPYYIETEFTEGGNLQTWFEEQGSSQVPLETRLELAAQIATALSAAHGAGILHKDINPSNILIAQSKDNKKPHACLADFGIGLLTDPDALNNRGITSSGLTQTLIASKSSSGSGTALYMAPELYEGKPPTAQFDIYSLGVLLYQFVIGDFSKAILAKAQGYAEEAIELSIKNNDRFWEGLSNSSMGRILGRRDASRIVEAEKYALKGISILNELKLRPYLSQSYFFLGELYANAGRKDEALENLNKALTMCHEMGIQYWPDKIQEVLDRL